MGKKHRSIFNTQFVTASISTTLVSVLLGTIVLFVLCAHNLSNYVKENINVSILINDDIDSTQIAAFDTFLGKLSYIKSKEYISKDDALLEECKEMGTDPSEFLGYNPFTASFEVKIKADYATQEQMTKIVKQLKGNTSVVDVIYQKDLIKAVNDNIRKISIILLVIAGLFAYISFALINNIVRLSIFSKRFVINTMKLVGASWNFIRRPFLWKGVTLGLISAVCANAILYGLISWVKDFDPQINLVIDNKVLLVVAVSVLLFAVIITFFCTLISLNRYLKMDGNKIYYI